MPNFWYLFAAYTLVWLGLCGYLLYLAQEVRALRRELQSRPAPSAEDGPAA